MTTVEDKNRFRSAIGNSRKLLGAAAICLISVTRIHAVPEATVAIEKPKARSATGGNCELFSDGSLKADWGASSLPMLAIVITPRSAGEVFDAMRPSKTPYTGPGKYQNVIVAVHLGKTALEESYLDLGTVVFNADNRTGSFQLNDGSASGRFDCGQPLQRRKHD